MCYVNFITNEIPLQLSIDLGTSHNFLKKELERELEIRVGQYRDSFKVINSNAKSIDRVATIVHI